MNKKKAGIIVAASAAALVGLSPIALAHEGTESFFGGGQNVSVPGTFCNNDATGSVAGGAAKDVTGSAAGAITGIGGSQSKSYAADEDNRACGVESEAGDGR